MPAGPLLPPWWPCLILHRLTCPSACQYAGDRWIRRDHLGSGPSYGGWKGASIAVRQERLTKTRARTAVVPVDQWHDAGRGAGDQGRRVHRCVYAGKFRRRTHKATGRPDVEEPFPALGVVVAKAPPLAGDAVDAASIRRPVAGANRHESAGHERTARR